MGKSSPTPWMLEKIEEQTLYIFQLKEKIAALPIDSEGLFHSEHLTALCPYLITSFLS